MPRHLSPSGLSEAEAARRRAAGQGNDTLPRAGRSYLEILVETAFAPVNTILFATCLVLAWLGLPLDAAVTSVPVALNVLASVILEARAKQQLDRLAVINRPAARVRRDHRGRDLPPEELVLGDLVVVARGDQIIVDGEIASGSLEVDESLLTGEAEPVSRGPGEPVLSGSACIGGKALYRVTQVGRHTYASRLVERARAEKAETTPLQRDVGRLVAGSAVLVLLVALPVAIGLSGMGRLASREAVQAAAVLVAIIPQGLVIIATLLYAAGALAITRAGALIQRISAVESMSRADTLVLDKTGTLTSPRLELQQCRVATGDMEARELLGRIADDPGFTDRTTLAIRAWLEAGGRESGNGGPGGPGRQRGDPPQRTADADRVAFSSARRWSGISGGPSVPAVILGAPEVLVPRLADADGLAAEAEQLAAQGLRVLMLARGPANSRLTDAEGAVLLPDRLVGVALLVFAEEIRPDALTTIQSLAGAGVRLKVVSGDHPRTVAAIARHLGLDGSVALDGTALTSLGEADLAQQAETASVFGRVDPFLKARLVRSLCDRGHTVAVIGDGVNDIVALKAADLGVAMQSGSAAARSAADVVLIGDSFAVLPVAVRAGQRIVEGMRMVTCLLFARTIFALAVVLGASLLALDFPLTPRTNSILALLTVGIPTLVLAAWAPSGRSPGSIIPSALRFSVPAGLAMAALALPVYWGYAAGPGGLPMARSALVVISTFAGLMLIPLLWPPGERPWRDLRPTLLAAAMVTIFMFVLAVPGLREVFELTAMPAAEVLALAVLALGWAAVLAKLRRAPLAERFLLASRRSGPD